MNDEARRIAEVLEIAAPEQASADELHQWVSWWKASYEAARALSDEQRHSFKSGGWWPPVSAAQIENSPPDIVRRTRRPVAREAGQDRRPDRPAWPLRRLPARQGCRAKVALCRDPASDRPA